MRGVFQQPIPDILKKQLSKKNNWTKDNKSEVKFVECKNCQLVFLPKKKQKFCVRCGLSLNKKVI